MTTVATVVNASLALTAVLLLVFMERVTGRVAANDGRGWDGADYSEMLDGWDRGTVNTVFGGISLFVIARGRVAMRQCLREPEWAGYNAVVLAAAAMGAADLWRYLVYLLPAAVVLFAVCACETGLPRRQLVTAAIVCIATILTQRPFQSIDLNAYFLDWFPYYIRTGSDLPPLPSVPSLWPVWGWRFLMTAGLLWLLAVSSPLPDVATSAEPKRGRPVR